MSMRDRIEKELSLLLGACYAGESDTKNIDERLTAILSIIREELPETMKGRCDKHSNSQGDQIYGNILYGYNACISEMERRVG